MNTALLIALIQSIAIPELTAWLRSRHDNGQTTLTDADVIAKLMTDTDLIVAVGEAWLKAHPPA